MQLPSADTDPNSSEAAKLSSYLLDQGWVDPTSKIVGISSPGAGNMNHTLRVHLDGHATASLILKQSVPYVAKYPDIPAPQDRDQSEAAFYSSIRNSAALAAHCPKLLGHSPAHHLLCFEDLGAGIDFTHLYPQDPLVPPQANAAVEPTLQRLLEWLGQLHQQPLPSGFPSNQAMRELNHEHIFVLPFVADNGLADHADLAAWQANLVQDKQAMLQIETLGALYLGQATSSLQSSKALLHGDFYPGSWLDSSTASAQAYVIDPEFGFVGPAEFDIGVFRAHLSMSGWTGPALDKLMSSYQPPSNFNPTLAAHFGAVEVMRRLLGVAKLPMQASVQTQLAWLTSAANLLRSGAI